MANITVSTNPSTTNNTLTVNFTTDVTNITDVQLTKDGSNYIKATSFTNTSATFNVASWSNGTYNNCYLKVIYTETSSGGSTGGDSGGSTGGNPGGDSGGSTGTYTSAVSEDFTIVGECSGISIDSSNNLVASTLDKFGMVKLNKPVRKLQFNVRDNQADHGALCWYIYNTYKDGASNNYNMIALSNVADGENGKLFNMDIPGTYSQEIDKLDIPAINPGEQLTIEFSDTLTTKRYKDDRINSTVIANELITTQTIKRADGTILTTLTGNMSGWCGQSTNSSPFCSNIQYVPEVVHDNPSYSVKDYKITLSQDGYSEVFDANNGISPVYCENSKDFVWEDGETYALALSEVKTGSKFRIDGMYPSAGGYRLENNESGEPYVLLENAYVPTVNNFNFSAGVRNGNLENQYQVDADLLNDCLRTFNCALPALNYRVDSDSANTIILDSYQESWLGLSMTENDRFLTRLNKSSLTSEYGDFNSDSSTDSYKAWKGTIVHELGHSLGFADNAKHYPTLYTYRRNRARVNYLQAPDIYTLKSLYKEKYNIDISKSQEDINSQVAALGLGTSSYADMPSDKVLSIQFDYPIFTDNELYDKADLIVEGKLEFDRCESINIGSENSPLILKYSVYKIIPNSVIKGEITNYELKIHISEKMVIRADNTYKLYLKQFENAPCSLVNIEQGIQIKE